MRPTGYVLPLALVIALSACGMKGGGGEANQNGGATTAASASGDDGLMSHDAANGAVADPAMADDTPRPLMQAQVVLDRLGFTPGVVDGKEGASTRNAVSGFQEARGLTVTGTFDDPTRQALAQWSNIPATRVVTIPADFAAGPFAPTPRDSAAQAQLPSLAYQTLDEKLAERFHTTIDTLKELNPQIVGAAPTGMASGAPQTAPASESAASPTAAAAASSPAASLFAAGQQIRVPNVGGDAIDPGKVSNVAWRDTLAMLGIGSNQPTAERIVVNKSKGTLRVYDKAEKLVAMYTATMGSSHDPLPLGNWKVKGTAYNPPFHYNPKLFWDVSDSKEQQVLPPGPNGPVGVVWIDLNKPHYGIHGTPEPQTIGRAESHGCVRLTNWDAARLAQMVSPGTRVSFEA